ncbi:hypothetical protein SEPCBS119000_002794 [Sporothrix epigloea]|uniref:UFSP1/2/DUB catalytic domain-containing protein n=1 Tax=Sporothrix epigloea TaxID=1892477 RepID=A0ABP0DI41_9PEZI
MAREIVDGSDSTGDAPAASGTGFGPSPVPAAVKSTSLRGTRFRSRSRTPTAGDVSLARSSSAPPVRVQPLCHRSSPKKSMDSFKSARAWNQMGCREFFKPVADLDNGRERQRHPERSRERGGNVTAELGLSAPGMPKSSRQTSLSRKPSKRIRSILAYFTGSDSRKAPNRALLDEEPGEKNVSAKRPAGRRQRSPPSAEGPALNMVRVVSDTPKRLGKAELGKYADEERMPDWLAVYLKQEWGVVESGKISLLAQLLEQNAATEYAYLCDPCVQHVSRLPKEGGFCGYRNIQTMISYIIGAESYGHETFANSLPSVFDIQNLIEQAWDRGFNPRGRIETGGIRLTRKYIGTPEAIALFQSLDIPCSINTFKHKTPGKSRDLIFRDIEQYFGRSQREPGQKVRVTSLPPIYWQHPGHSLTIVGIEKTKAGGTNLLVFDPVSRDASVVARLVGQKHALSDQLLRPYRRDSRYLSRFHAFEILKLQPVAEDCKPQSEAATQPGP